MITSTTNPFSMKDEAQKIEGRIQNSDKELQIDAQCLERHAKGHQFL